ncbi:MAG: D-alanyl-D-alanine carboxypeptidase, partial [Lachnospiraceae bacterium]|nr:D-alanyl-D-alanine carboxypeptidase [Lachnospiraceae bacterium]
MKYRIFTVFLCFFVLSFNTTLTVFATQEELLEEAEERKNDPVESNNVENWPQGPLIGAKAAVLMDANTGAILY